MKKYIKSITIALCISCAFSVHAQEFVFGYSLGKADYQMDDLKSILKNDVKNNVKMFNDLYDKEFKYKTTENFPDGLFHDAYFGLKFSFHEIGLQYNYLTTGGRNRIADYSGELKKDIVFSGDAIGLYYKMHFLSVPLTKDLRLSTYAGISTGAIFNQGHADNFLDLYHPQSGSSYRDFEKIDESYNWHSANWYVQPNIGFQFWFKNTVSLNINAGYLFDNPGKIRTGDENTQNIQIVYTPRYGYEIKEYTIQGKEYDFGVNWSGLRFSVGIGFAFSVINR